MDPRRDHSIRDVVRDTGLTSRTLRHFDDVGLLHPSSLGAGGERRYDHRALLRLQRILLLRELGLPLGRIREVLDRERDDHDALAEHAATLRTERERLTSRIRAVESTLIALQEGRTPTMTEMFEGFDQRRHRDEVEQRWGHAAAKTSSQWWDGLDGEARGDWMAQVAALNAAWVRAAASGADPRGADAQELAARHVAWLASVPGTPAARAASGAAESDEATAVEGADIVREYVAGLAEMYVADERFAANYGGVEGARFVREALRAHLGLD